MLPTHQKNPIAPAPVITITELALLRLIPSVGQSVNNKLSDNNISNRKARKTGPLHLPESGDK